MVHPFGPLRARNFRLHFTGQVLSNVGTWFQALAQTLLVLELSGSAAALGLVTALQFLPMLLLGPYGGVLADRLRPRTMLMATSGAAALLAGVLAAITALGQVTLPSVYAIAFLLGFVQALDRPSAQTFLYELVGPDELPRAASLHSITQSSARMVGPALGGATYALLGPATCFAVNALSFLCVIAALLRVRPGELWARGEDAGQSARDAWDGVRYALRTPELRAPLSASVVISCLAFAFMTTVTSMVKLELHGGATAVGAAHALNAAGAVAGGLLIASLGRPPTLALLAATCGAMALTIAVNALAPSLLAFLAWAPVFGFSIGAYQATLLATVQRATEPRLLGRVSGLLVLATVGVMPIASLIAGLVTEAFSARAAMGLGAAACLIAALGLARPLGSRAAPGEPAT